MKIYLQRHCETDPGEQMDADRPLNKRGKRQAKTMRKFLKMAAVKPDVIISSDFARAGQTAKRMQRGDTPIKTTPFLRPSVDWQDKEVSGAWKSIAKLAGDANSILVITHGPLVQRLLASVAFNFHDEDWNFEHGSIAYVNTGDSRFRWFCTPKLAAHLTDFIDPKDVESKLAEAWTRELEANIAASSLPNEWLFVAENLRHAHHAIVVDPLVNHLRFAVASRFRRQKRSVMQHVKMYSHGTAESMKDWALLGVVKSSPKFEKRYEQLTSIARTAGESRASSQFTKLTENASDPQGIGPPKRTGKDLEDELDRTTKKELGDMFERIAQESQTPLSLAAALQAIRSKFDEYAVGAEGKVPRSETVAVTEISTAYHDGMADAVKLAPHSRDIEKIWAVEDGACPICEANAGMGWILADQPFDSGDDSPPQHPNCRCSVDYRSSEAEVAE